MYSVQIGAQLYSIRDRTQTAEDMRAALREIRAMGYHTCQISGQNRQISASEMRDILDETGLECVCTHITFDEMLKDIDKVIEHHRTLKCKYPGIGGLPDRYRNSAGGYRQFAKEAGEIAERLHEAGMHFIYHNHNFEFNRLDGKTGLEWIYEQTPDCLQMELDLYWIQAAGASPIEWIEKVAGRMDVIHFKDMAPAPGETVRMTTIGDGNMNWKNIMEACDKAGVKYALVEQDNAVETDSIACMRRSFKNLQAMGARFA